MNIARTLVMMIVATMQQPAVPQDAARHLDEYAIYSTMVSEEGESYIRNSKTIAIAGTTFPAVATQTSPLMPPASAQCLTAPRGYEARFSEVLAELNAGNDSPITLVPELKLAKPYVYLSAADVAQVRNNQTRPFQSAGAEGLVYLGNVYFSKDRTLAVTGIATKCGPKCAKGEWRIYEKTANGEWRRIRAALECVVES